MWGGGVVPRVCEAMEAASAPAGKPPAKRLGKQIYVSIKSIKLYHKSEYILYIKPSLLSTNVGFYGKCFICFSFSPHQGAGWRLCLECLCEGIGVGSVFNHFFSRLDLRPMIMYAMT